MNQNSKISKLKTIIDKFNQKLAQINAQKNQVIAGQIQTKDSQDISNIQNKIKNL